MRQPTFHRSGSRALRCLPFAGLMFLAAPGLAVAQTPPAEAPADGKKATAAAEQKLSVETGTSAASTTAPEKAAVETAKSAGKPSPSPEKAAPDAAKPGSAPAFVDRDGDGIQDGQEHRFRHRKSAGKHRSGSCGDSSGGMRARERSGQEEGQKQHQGGR